MPPRSIQLIPTHPPRRLNNLNTRVLGAPQKRSLPLHIPTPTPSTSTSTSTKPPLPLPSNLNINLPLQPHSPRIPHPQININPPIIRIPLSPLKAALDAREEIEVAIESGFGVQLAAAEVGAWVADARALGPELVAARAGERAGAG